MDLKSFAKKYGNKPVKFIRHKKKKFVPIYPDQKASINHLINVRKMQYEVMAINALGCTPLIDNLSRRAAALVINEGIALWTKHKREVLNAPGGKPATLFQEIDLDIYIGTHGVNYITACNRALGRIVNRSALTHSQATAVINEARNIAGLTTQTDNSHFNDDF